MPDGRITRFVPGRGLVVIGFKSPVATVNFIYNPITGVCPVQNGQLKQAKQFLKVTSCCFDIMNPYEVANIIDGGEAYASGQIMLSGGTPSSSGSIIIDGGYVGDFINISGGDVFSSGTDTYNGGIPAGSGPLIIEGGYS